MKNTDRLSGIGRVLVAALMIGISGCSMQLTMSPLVSSAELAERRIPQKVALFMDSDFQNYQWDGFSGAEWAKLHYELGPASKNLFLQAFKLVANDVTLVESKPPFADPARNDIAIVVQPRIVSFSEKHSLLIRNADYYAEITYHVTVYDKAGQTILDKDYSAEGVAMGWTDLNRNYEAPVEKAMEQVIVTIIDDISKLRR